jgi:hypothetical protein
LSDLHIRVLRLMAQRAKGELEAHDALDHGREGVGPTRRRRLVAAASRTRLGVRDAEARRSDRLT